MSIGSSGQSARPSNTALTVLVTIFAPLLLFYYHPKRAVPHHVDAPGFPEGTPRPLGPWMGQEPDIPLLEGFSQQGELHEKCQQADPGEVRPSGAISAPLPKDHGDYLPTAGLLYGGGEFFIPMRNSSPESFLFHPTRL